MSRPLRVLLISDSLEDAESLLRHLRRAGCAPECEQVADASALAAALDREEWDILLCEDDVAALSPRSVLRLLAGRRSAPPMLVLTNTPTEERAATLLKAGARDCLPRENLARLAPAIERELQHARCERAARDAREALRHSEHFVQHVADTIPDMLYVLDLAERRNVYANDQVCRFFGCTQEEVSRLLSGFFAQRLHPDDFPRLARMQQRFAAAQDGDVIETEFRMRRADGEWRWVRARDTVFSRTSDGLPLQILGTAEDITERREAEDELARARQRLLDAEVDKKRFYREVIRAVTEDRFHLVDASELPRDGLLLLEMPISGPMEYTLFRKHVCEAARDCGMSEPQTDDILLAASEAATNAIKHGCAGRCAILIAPDRLIVRISDAGPGIQPENLPATILRQGFSTKVSLGMGYTVMLRLMDRVWLATGPDGTIVQLEKWLDSAERAEALVPAAWALL